MFPTLFDNQIFLYLKKLRIYSVFSAALVVLNLIEVSSQGTGMSKCLNCFGRSSPLPPLPPLPAPGSPFRQKIVTARSFVPLELKEGDVIVRLTTYYAKYFEDPERYILLNEHNGIPKTGEHGKYIEVDENSIKTGDYVFRNDIKIGIFERHNKHKGFRMLPEAEREHEVDYLFRMRTSNLLNN
ncbi:uncharacterized protein LOC117177476 [Belonocnema kinseyi]|uniref:uncharacterized protein LOC117177476 n=1 Tax=Belonocnema kinseyi TaxID=2817044 RepID=UPI00143DD96C|nr:uncharacterized protein LOC117177476 [Belonocnema kinseyi]